MSNLKEPLPIMPETGYMKTELHLSSVRGANRIIEHLDEVKRQMRERGEDVQDIETGEIYSLIYEYIAAAYKLKHAHKLAADLIEKYGYRPLTAEDFKRYGVKPR